MALDHVQANRLYKDAVEAMRRGHSGHALRCIETLEDTPFAQWLLISQLRKAAGDHEGAERAVDQLLLQEPRSLAGLILKGDCRAFQQDRRAATAFYNAALAVADGMTSVPDAMQASLFRIQDAVRGYLKEYEDGLCKVLKNAGIKPSERISEALDIVTGRRQIYPQEPLSFYYPGLPLLQFYDRRDFAWAADLEAETSAIRTELLNIMREDNAFHPYLESDPSRPARPNNALVADCGWSAYHLWRNGVRLEEQASRCPRTMAALDLVPSPQVASHSPMALFSLMKPGMHIIPHHGLFNTRLICHLPLIVPSGCTLRVGNEERAWREGELMIFDDSIEHEARNASSETRVVLLFDVWRPEIVQEDRVALALLFEHVAHHTDPGAAG